MRETGHPIQLPMRNGVSASVVSVPQGAPHLLDFLAQRMPGISRSEWAERLAQGLVLHEDGQAALPDQSCQPGQRLYYYRHLDDEPVLPFQAQVLFEDDHLLVVDKPHFMPVTPSGRYVQQSLLVQLKRQTGCADLVPLHRIDRETAGLVLFGKRLQERDAYHALFRDRVVDKRYEAIAPHDGDVAFPLTRRSRIEEDVEAFFRMVEVDGEPNSETRIQRIEVSGTWARLSMAMMNPGVAEVALVTSFAFALGIIAIQVLVWPFVPSWTGRIVVLVLTLLAAPVVWVLSFGRV